jgi:hypothetical protein
MPIEPEMAAVNRQIGRHGNFLARPHPQQSAIVADPELYSPRLTSNSLSNLPNQRQFAPSTRRRSRSLPRREFCTSFPHGFSIGHAGCPAKRLRQTFPLPALGNLPLPSSPSHLIQE